MKTSNMYLCSFCSIFGLQTNHELVVWSADNNLCILFCKIKEKKVPVKLDSFQIFLKVELLFILNVPI